MDFIMSLLSQIDPKILTISLVILVILCIVSIIKKMVKLVITFVAIAIVVSILMPTVTSIQNKYNFSINDAGVVEMVVDGERITFDKLDCKEIRVTTNEENITVEIMLDNASPEFEMPKFMRKPLEVLADKADIEFNGD